MPGIEGAAPLRAPMPSRATEPRWLKAARGYLGIHETPGIKNNPVIMGWAKTLGVKVLGILYADDSATPWCGLFVAQCMSISGIEPPSIAIRAKSWATWGRPVNPVRGPVAGGCSPGTVLVFERPGGGHVGFYVGETATRYRVLGGNQGDAVSLTWIDKARCVAARWPDGEPRVGGPVVLASNGQPSSTNEA